ncbi:MAG: ATP-binding protein [Candidatus Pelethousia sp.]|nr:ATP-binding protein [Candidatus Pelethousia sp.]
MTKNAAKTMLVMTLATGCSLLIASFGVNNESIIMVFLLGVLFTAVLTSSKGWATGTSIVSAILFNYLFTEPRYSFFVYSTNDLMLLAFFLVTGIVSGTVTSRLQNEMELANRNEGTARTLYQIASSFLSACGKETVVKKAEDLIQQYADLDCTIVLGQDKTGQGYAIQSGSGRLGRLIPSQGEPQGQKLLIVQAVCTQLGIALERENLVAEREEIRLAMEREHQRGMLLRSIAHDLRSPLTALSGAGNLLADNYDSLTDSERKKLAGDLSEEIIWLTDLVENILNMTRISERKIVLHKQDEVVDDVIGEAVKHTERLFGDRRFRVKLPDEVIAVPMDGKLISQVIINLLENAVRHAPQKSEITLAVETEGGQMKVSVADTGNGVPEEIRGRLFESFVTQDKGVVDGRRGLGLGLAICKAIVEAHGGKIHVEDNVPSGSVFIFTLPMEESE